MADQTLEATGLRDGENDDEAPLAWRPPSLIDRTGDNLPAFVTFVVGILVILWLAWQGGLFDFRFGDDDAIVADAIAGQAAIAISDATASAAPAPEADPAGETDAGAIDLAAISAAFQNAGVVGIDLSAEGGILTVTGEVPNEEAKAQLLAFLTAQPGVESIVDQLTLAEGAAAESSVEVSASQASIVLSGVVPSQELSDALTAQAATIYGADQIDNQLVVDETTEPPITMAISGTVTDPVLFAAVTEAFAGIEGLDGVSADGFVLGESDELETALNDLEPIQFGSGSSVILDESLPVLDQAADFLNANPEVAIEIGGHTDSVGDDAGNQSLSEARALAVQEALVARGVTNVIEPRGFGESRLKEDPDETPEAQQANRRIEFRILN